MGPLKNHKHEAFCREVAGGMSLEAAWVSVGNNDKAHNAARLAKQPKVQTRIAELRAEFNRGCTIQLAWLQEKLLSLATADATRYFETTEAGELQLRNITMLPAELRAAISEVRIDEDRRVIVKVHDKRAAIETLIKTLGGFAPERLELSGRGGGPLEVQTDQPSNFEVARRIARVLQQALPQVASATIEHSGGSE